MSGVAGFIQERNFTLALHRHGDPEPFSGGMVGALDWMAIREDMDMDRTGVLHDAYSYIGHEDALLRLLQWTPFRDASTATGTG